MRKAMALVVLLGGCGMDVDDGGDVAVVSAPSTSCAVVLKGAHPPFSANPYWAFFEQDVRGPGVHEEHILRIPRGGGIVRDIATSGADSFGGVLADAHGFWFAGNNAHGEKIVDYYTRDGVRLGQVYVGRAQMKVSGSHFYWVDHEGVTLPDPMSMYRVDRSELSPSSQSSGELVVTAAGAILDYDFGNTYVYYLDMMTEGALPRLMKVAKTGGSGRLLYSTTKGRLTQVVVVGGYAWMMRRDADPSSTATWADIVRVNAATGSSSLIMHLDDAGDAPLYRGSDTAYLKVYDPTTAALRVYRLDGAAKTMTLVPSLDGVTDFQIDATGMVYYKNGVMTSEPASCP